jgi:hypothetical protein
MNAFDLIAPMSRAPSCDAWGNIRNTPVKVIEESHDDNFVKIFIYEIGGRFYYGYQIKAGKMLKQKAANINDQSFETKDLARVYGCVEIETACNSNKNTRKLFAEFKRIANAQLELFLMED